VYNWLSYNIVRFKIEVAVEEKFTCKNVTKQTHQGDWVVVAGSHFCSGTPYKRIRRRRQADSSQIFRLGSLNGDNMLFEYLFYPPRSNALFSNYFEDLFSFTVEYFDSHLITCDVFGDSCGGGGCGT